MDASIIIFVVIAIGMLIGGAVFSSKKADTKDKQDEDKKTGILMYVFGGIILVLSIGLFFVKNSRKPKSSSNISSIPMSDASGSSPSSSPSSSSSQV